MEIGKQNQLSVKEIEEKGYFLTDDEQKIVFLPQKECTQNYKIGDTINVFIYTDNKGTPIATTKKSKIELNCFEVLEIVENTTVGSFANWGLSEDLLIPFSDQDFELIPNEKIVVFLYLDEKSKRLRGSTVFYEHTQNEKNEYTPGDEVELLVCEHSDLGITVIIDNKHEGLLYNDEVYDIVEVGDKLKGFIKKVRPDHKIDVTLHKFGYRNVEPNAQKILDALQKNDGFLELSDKTDPEIIKAQLKMSKKTFKKALGALYKQRLISIEENGVYLLK